MRETAKGFVKTGNRNDALHVVGLCLFADTVLLIDRSTGRNCSKSEDLAKGDVDGQQNKRYPIGNYQKNYAVVQYGNLPSNLQKKDTCFIGKSEASVPLHH